MSNKAYYSKKILSLIATILLITVLSFFAFSVIPGDAAAIKLGTGATEEQLSALREEMGLNDNLAVRYFKWLGGVVTGDFGDSFYYNMPISELIPEKIVTTVLLTLVAVMIVIAVSITLAILCARKAGGWCDRILSAISKVLMAFPPFFTGLLITLFFGLILKVFTVGGFVSYRKDFLSFLGFIFFPALAIALPKACMTADFLRDGLVKEMKKNYVKTLRFYGFKENYILFKHALKNAMIPTINFIGVVITEMLAGSVIVEQIFGVKGLGTLLLGSVQTRDLPLLQAIVLFIGVSVVVINFLVDIICGIVDPRTKLKK